MFAYNNSSTQDDFLYEFGNIEVIEKMKKRELKEQERITKLAKKFNEEANLKREQLKKKEKEEKEQEELYKMYMELDHIRIKSKEGTIKSEPKSIDKKSIDKKSIDKKSIDKNDSIKSDNSSVQSLHVYRPSIR
jgi:DNA-binding protein H-NS